MAFLAPSAAAAGTAESGLWWFDRGDIQAAHDAGFDGSGVKVAVIDSQINPDVVGLRGADVTVREPSYCLDPSGRPYPAMSTDYVAASHATRVASMIVGTGEAPPGGAPVKGVAPGVELLFYTAPVLDGVVNERGEDAECLQEDGTSFDEDGREGLDHAISDAVADGADIISISSFGTDASKGIAEAYANDVVVVAGMGNDDGIDVLPAALNGVVAVQAFGEDGKIQNGQYGKPNVSDYVVTAGPGIGLLLQGASDSWEAQSLGSGTSYATPIVAGMLAVVKQKYPEATAGQLIQSLIHNTGTKGEHEPEWNSGTGYGAASLTGMLAVDPAKYPDENPIFDTEDPNASPSLAMVNEVKAANENEKATASPQPSSAPGEAQQPSEVSAMPWVIGGIVVAVLIVGGIILAIVLTRSARRQTTDQGGNHDR
ncbi:S8 family peptidase [Zhihengliuella sp. ISTPL4]|uniref:S8 family peptidase n=1 Tax=Zhihengliuella sp. ISTPL4 TaxID=2058657 RepID=UPI00257051BA|nr:S8 family serine peptidase [Zhihengliuella sp. ISTPL4]